MSLDHARGSGSWEVDERDFGRNHAQGGQGQGG